MIKKNDEIIMKDIKRHSPLYLGVNKIMYAKKLIVCVFFIHLTASQDFPRVVTNLGKIRGHYKTSSKGNNYEAYEGIPYALPPIGYRRFMPPEPIQPWEKEFIADKFGCECVGYSRHKNENGDFVRGVEDCLYLNIYLPVKKSNSSLLPVIFWIYGGAFQFSTLKGTEQHYLIDHNVIFVGFNYRHGTLGFLSTEDEVVTGNMGLKDQAMALSWVSKNIQSFGGDPKKITIMGLSAGGASVHYHYLSKMSSGLFRSGVSFSATAFNSWTQAKNSREKAIQIGRLMNCSIDNTAEMVNCLRSRSAYDIVKAQEHFMPWHLNEFAPFGPVVEKNSPNPFIDRSPIDIINSGDVYDAPWITGVVSEEGLCLTADFATNETAFEDLDRNWDTIAPHLLQYYYSIPKKDHASVAQTIRKHYFGHQPISQKNFLNLTHLVGDRSFVVDAEKAARAQAEVNKSPVWFYRYSYRASVSVSDKISNTTENFGASHGDDVLLILYLLELKTEKDMAMHNGLMKFWMSVVRESVPDFGTKWNPINPNDTDLRYLHMIAPGEFTEETNNNIGEKTFWNTIDFN